MKSCPCMVRRPLLAGEMHECKSSAQLPERTKLVGQEERRGGSGRASHLGMAPVLEQGGCKADVYVSQAEDPHGVVSVTQWLNRMSSVLVPVLRLQGVPG